MRESDVPIWKGLRGLPDERSAPATSTAGDAWGRRRLEAFSFIDDSRLLQSYRLAALILRDRDEAEDATQEAIARAWSAWGALRDTSRFDAWFDRILVNVCRNRLRHVGAIRMVALDDAFDVPGSDSQGPALARLTLEPAFARLTPDQRIIVVLRFWRDLPMEEIADRLGIPTGTVKSRLHYALKTLREAIESSEEAQR
jgi:RNA polymerase sigma factor (sigma-70 family)